MSARVWWSLRDPRGDMFNGQIMHGDPRVPRHPGTSTVLSFLWEQFTRGGDTLWLSMAETALDHAELLGWGWVSGQ